MPDPDFRKELEALINRHSLENGSNTPDFILADYMTECLDTFDRIVKAREKWHGRKPTIAELHALLESEDRSPVRIEPDGTVTPVG
jgi:DNA-binding response OmpR family regulator